MHAEAQSPPSALVFAVPSHRSLLASALELRSAPAAGRCAVERFSNDELCLRVDEDVRDRECAVLGSLAPPDEEMLEVLLLAHTLRREGARRVVALLPYLGYARQDRADPGQSLGTAWVGDLLAGVGIAEVITLDVHSARAVEHMPLPVRSLSPASIFADALARLGMRDVTVVAPDEGALKRCEAVARAAGAHVPVAHLRKRRDVGGVTHSALVGDVTERVVVVDDILDTGSTLVSSCRALRDAGVREITVVVTHGLFTGQKWRDLARLGVRRIYATDSVPDVQRRGGELVELLPIGRLIISALASTSVSAESG